MTSICGHPWFVFSCSVHKMCAAAAAWTGADDNRCHLSLTVELVVCTKFVKIETNWPTRSAEIGAAADARTIGGGQRARSATNLGDKQWSKQCCQTDNTPRPTAIRRSDGLPPTDCTGGAGGTLGERYAATAAGW